MANDALSNPNATGDASVITWCHPRATRDPRARTIVGISTKLSSRSSVSSDALPPLRVMHTAALRSARTTSCSPRTRITPPAPIAQPRCRACQPSTRPAASGCYYSYAAADHALPAACHASVSATVAGNIAFLARYAAMVGQ